MLENNYYTPDFEKKLKKKVLRKIIVFVFALNMFIARFAGDFSQARNENVEQSSVSYSRSADTVYNTELPTVLSDDIQISESEKYDRLFGDAYNDVLGYADEILRRLRVMRYKGFYVKITPDTDLHRKDKDGNDIRCNGFTIEVFADESEKIEINVFSVAVNFELLKDSLEEAEKFAKNYIDCEEKEYRRIIDEFNE